MNPRNQTINLLSNVAATGDYVRVPGGQYIWACQGTFGGATLTLQAKGPDGSTAMSVGTMTAAGAVSVDVGEGTEIRVAVTGGTPSALYSSLRGVL